MESKETSNCELVAIGWREWVRIPELGIKRLKAKIDTGAKSSSLHAYDIEIAEIHGEQQARFLLHPDHKNPDYVEEVRIPIAGFRKVRSSNGILTTRPVIRTEIELFRLKFLVDITLFDRTKMGFRMLVGREALAGRFTVDCSQSFCGGKPKKARRHEAANRSIEKKENQQ